MNIAGLTGHQIENPDEVASPALLLYPHRVRENISRLLAMVDGDTSKVRPHVKTHKLGAIVQLQLDAGITKFKCATIAEAEMAADAGACDVLLAYQMVGPNVTRICALASKFPETKFSVLADNEVSLRFLSAAATESGVFIGVFIDLDCGMHRSGVAPGEEAARVYRLMGELSGLKVCGLHAYDGHIHDSPRETRIARSDAAFVAVREFRQRLLDAGLSVPSVVAGGTPTYPVHARRDWVECSPGTCLLTDAGYGTAYSDLEFVPAAFLLTRVISKPGGKRICLDLGHKAVAAENPIANRVRFPELPDAVPLSQSEEHLVLETDAAENIEVGQVFYGLPWHVCPSVALYSEAAIVSEDGRVSDYWPILARARTITV